MLTAQTKRRLFWLAESLLLAAARWVTTVLLSQAQEWSSLPLVGLLLALALIGQRLSVTSAVKR